LKPGIPFGDADAARVNAFQRADFVEFDRRRFRNTLALAAGDRDVRVIVGAKGAGKTIYLRRLEQALSGNRGVYVDRWQNRPPATAQVLEVWSTSKSAHDCRRRWALIWRRAIMRSLATHMVTARRLGTPDAIKETLRYDFAEVLPSFETRSSVIAEVGTIISEHRGVTQLDSFLHSPRWATLEQIVADALDDLRPVYFILDGIDEEFELAPSQWLDCQIGLFREVMSLSVNAMFRSRLHVIVGIRDLVYSTALQSENKMRLLNTPTIRNLQWDRDAISHFLSKKASSLDDEWLMSRGSTDPVQRWLGMETIRNVKRGTVEQTESYLLRHTRGLPRDVVQLGNSLCECIDRAVCGGDHALNDELVRRAVAGVSRDFGLEQLRIATNHITAALMPREAPRQGFAEVYVADDATHGYQSAIFDLLRKGLSSLEEDRVEACRLRLFAEELNPIGEVDLLSILWQHRLIGYVAGDDRLHDPVVFYGMNGEDLTLPPDRSAYALHPSLIDAVGGIRGVGAPVEM
jgi:hypothetical protein